MSERHISSPGKSEIIKVEENNEDLTVFLSGILDVLETKYPELADVSYATDLDLKTALSTAIVTGESIEVATPDAIIFNRIFYELDRANKESTILKDNFGHVSELLGFNVFERGDKVKILQAYLLLHELGHIKDIRDHMESLGGSENAINFFLQEQANVKVLGLTFDQLSSISVMDFIKLKADNSDFFEKNNIQGIHDLILLAAKAHRDSPQEKRADSFAVDNIDFAYPGLVKSDE